MTVHDNERRAYFVSAGGGGGGRARRAMPIVRDQSSSRRWMRSSDVKRCCGSRVFVPQGQRETTGQFRRRALGGPVIHLLQVRNPGIYKRELKIQETKKPGARNP